MMVTKSKAKVNVSTGQSSHVKIISGGSGRSIGVGVSQVQAVPAYSGPYVVTPGRSSSILHTAGKKMNGNVVVQAIPSNYGKISWNGSTLTVE